MKKFEKYMIISDMDGTFFGEKAVEFLFGAEQITYYRLLYCLMVFFGSQITMTLLWELSDFFNGMMFVTNVLCLLLMKKH